EAERHQEPQQVRRGPDDPGNRRFLDEDPFAARCPDIDDVIGGGAGGHGVTVPRAAPNSGSKPGPTIPRLPPPPRAPFLGPPGGASRSRASIGSLPPHARGSG